MTPARASAQKMPRAGQTKEAAEAALTSRGAEQAGLADARCTRRIASAPEERFRSPEPRSREEQLYKVYGPLGEPSAPCKGLSGRSGLSVTLEGVPPAMPVVPRSLVF